MALKYKVGDRVKIKSLDWYNENKDNDAKFLIKEMSEFCGKIMTIKRISGIYYIMEESAIEYGWTDEMIEGLVEPIDCKKCGLTCMSTRCLFMDNCPHNQPKNTIEIPKDWVLKDENGNIINATKIVLEKKKKEYPKTYEECCKVLNTDDDSIIDISVPLHYNHLLISFTQLLICRDAYWKLYGEKMGLGKPWEPDFSSHEEKFSISVFDRRIVCIVNQYDNIILTFPTREMRDAFYENFKELIESVKEFL